MCILLWIFPGEKQWLLLKGNKAGSFLAIITDKKTFFIDR